MSKAVRNYMRQNADAIAQRSAATFVMIGSGGGFSRPQDQTAQEVIARATRRHCRKPESPTLLNALEKHLERQQDSAAALEAIARCLRAISTRKDELSQALVVDLCELAVGISTDLNNALDIVNLPKGVLA